VLLARYFGLVPIEELNLDGTLYYPELIPALVDRYGFTKYPTSPETIDENKGVEFIGGRSGKRVINKVTILDTGIYLDTSISTEASEELWYELMEWAVARFGVTFNRDMVKRYVYVSTITFHTDVPILALDPILVQIGEVAAAEVERCFGRRLEYEPAGISIQYDQQSTKLGTAPFTIQRREGVPFGDNKYFSTAPLKTNLHLELIERLEKAMSR